MIGVGIADWLNAGAVGSDSVGLLAAGLAELEAGFPALDPKG